MTAVKAGVWLRVSTGHQEADNQVPDVERFAAHHGYEVTRTYRTSDSAYKNGGAAEYTDRAAILGVCNGTGETSARRLPGCRLGSRGRRPDPRPCSSTRMD